MRRGPKQSALNFKASHAFRFHPTFLSKIPPTSSSFIRLVILAFTLLQATLVAACPCDASAGAWSFDLGSLEFLFDSGRFFRSVVPWLPMAFCSLHDLPGSMSCVTLLDAETPYRANVEFGVCSDDDTVLIHADSSWLHNPSKISKISCLDTAGNLAGFSLAPRCWSHPSLSCYAGYERDWYLSHGEDWAAGAFSTGLCILLDIADDYDPGLAHVGFLVSREGGMALHGLERLWTALMIFPHQMSAVLSERSTQSIEWFDTDQESRLTHARPAGSWRRHYSIYLGLCFRSHVLCCFLTKMYSPWPEFGELVRNREQKPLQHKDGAKQITQPCFGIPIIPSWFLASLTFKQPWHQHSCVQRKSRGAGPGGELLYFSYLRIGWFHGRSQVDGRNHGRSRMNWEGRGEW